MWATIGRILLGTVLSWVASLFAPKPEPPKAGTLEDFSIPKAEEGDEIGKVFGTVVIRKSQVAAHGDLRSEEIRDKAGKK